MGKIMIEKDTKYDKGNIVIFNHSKNLYIGVINSYGYDEENEMIIYTVTATELSSIEDSTKYFTHSIYESTIIGIITDDLLNTLNSKVDLLPV